MLAIVTELPAGQTVPLADVAEALELDPAQPRTAERLRAALEALEEAVLVWHTWLPDGTRALFQPMWPPPERAETRDQAQPPEPIEGAPVDLPARYPAALAWDLLSLLRWLGAGTPTVASHSALPPCARGRQLDGPALESWWRRTVAGAISNSLRLWPNTKTCSNRPMLSAHPALTARVRRDPHLRESAVCSSFPIWMGAGTWIEAQDQEEVVVTGAHWPQFRRRLLVLLAELDPARWYRFEDLTRWLSRRSSDALGDIVQIATARPIGATLDRSSERLSSLEQVVERTLRSGFAWFGLVQIGHVPSIGEVARLTEAALVASGLYEQAGRPPAQGAPIAIHPDLTVTLREPSPLRVWSLTAFADQIRLMPVAEYRITNRSLQRALSAGFRVEDVVTFLERQTGELLEDAAKAQLRGWAEIDGAHLARAGPDDPGRARRGHTLAAGSLTAAGLHVELLRGAGLLAHGPEGMPVAALTEQVTAVLQELARHRNSARRANHSQAARPNREGQDNRLPGTDRSGRWRWAPAWPRSVELFQLAGC